MSKINKEQAKGMLYGLYAGDILGAPLEFDPLDGVPKVTEYTDGVHHMKKGQFTDDTSMTLALMHSLSDDSPPYN